MPEGLPIDQEGKLNGLISSYAQQVLVCTGKDDWSSRIEEDNNGDNLAADLKELMGRGGTYSDVSLASPLRLVSFPSRGLFHRRLPALPCSLCPLMGIHRRSNPG